MSAYVLRKKTDTELKKIVDDVVRLVLETDDLKVDKIILYGSYAKGTADEESDIDIMILCDNNEEDTAKKEYDVCVSLASRISLENDVEISLMLRRNDYFNQWVNVLPFYQNVRDEGVVIYG